MASLFSVSSRRLKEESLRLRASSGPASPLLLLLASHPMTLKQRQSRERAQSGARCRCSSSTRQAASPLGLLVEPLAAFLTAALGIVASGQGSCHPREQLRASSVAPSGAGGHFPQPSCLRTNRTPLHRPPSVIIVILLSTHSIRSSPPFALFPTLSLNHRSQSVDVPRQHRRRHRHRLCYHRSWRNVPRSWDQSAGGASCIASSCLLLVTVRIKGQREISSSRKQKCLAPP